MTARTRTRTARQPKSQAATETPRATPKKRKASPRRRKVAVAPVSHEKIAEEAFRIWEAQGRPHGQEVAHWLEAERRLAVASAAA